MQTARQGRSQEGFHGQAGDRAAEVEREERSPILDKAEQPPLRTCLPQFLRAERARLVVLLHSDGVRGEGRPAESLHQAGEGDQPDSAGGRDLEDMQVSHAGPFHPARSQHSAQGHQASEHPGYEGSVR